MAAKKFVVLLGFLSFFSASAQQTAKFCNCEELSECLMVGVDFQQAISQDCHGQYETKIIIENARIVLKIFLKTWKFPWERLETSFESLKS